jgi:hypothetical protein
MSRYPAAQLTASRQMRPISGSTDVSIPVDVLWRCFSRPSDWPLWNPCFVWARNRALVLNELLVWVFQPIRPAYLYKMPAVARIVELEDGQRVTWEVTVVPGMYARHTYEMHDLGGGRTRFSSWEQAMGWSFGLTRRFWLAHFTFVCHASLTGARRLEQLYRRHGRLDREVLLAGARPRENMRAAVAQPEDGGA